ncbi:hypothetical protein PINS_up011951 [Pythium insidiosum]|nr:hypothetical protein PINS_up011951 [Pythium insidiosum]
MEAMDALKRLMWAPSQPESDIQRWYQQGFVFQSSPFPLGLLQGHGGPCGVLAAVQAELLRLYLFPDRDSKTVEQRELR